MNETNSIYIVEDEKIVALDIKNHLLTLGYNVLGISSSGEDFLEKMNTLQPDLVLMDINLAGQLTGIETAQRISELRAIPIVFLTAYTDDRTLKEIKRTGYYGYVTKPFKEIDLKTEIEFTIDRFNKVQKLKKEHDESRTSLKETEEFFKQVVDNVSDFIYRVDLKGNFTYVNPSAIKQTGYSKEELLGMKYTSLVRDDYRQKAYSFFRNIFQNRIDNSYFEFPLITRRGEELWIGQKIHLLRSNNLPVGFQVVARDITKEKEFKEQLIVAKKNAENTAKIKSQFLANMSHEIRTPLNGIIGVVNLLDNTELTDKQRTYINAIMSSSNQLLGIINDVLDLSKIEAGKMEIVAGEFDLYELVQSVISIFEFKTAEKGITISFTIDDKVPAYLVGDSIRLNQILYNLIGNAVKFTENGQVELNVKVQELKDRTCEIVFEITDSGIGMTKETMDRIFEAFTQAEGDTTRKFGGTGLGLAIVKKLVELQGGNITVSSKLNEGSTFRFGLKYGVVDGKSLGSNRKTDVKEIDLSGIHVLLVEDNPINQLVTKDLLNESHAVVTVANHGQEALDQLKKGLNCDVILMDMQMPVLDGYQTMQHIRESSDDQLKQIPILALTANAIEAEIEKCYTCGADDYLSKPFKPDILYVKILKLLDNKRENKGLIFQEHIEMEALNKFTNGKQALIDSTLKMLETTLEEDFEGLRSACETGDIARIRSLCHKMKPNFILIGMEATGKLCKELELYEENAHYRKAIDNLILKIPEVLEEIRDYNTQHV